MMLEIDNKVGSEAQGKTVDQLPAYIKSKLHKENGSSLNRQTPAYHKILVEERNGLNTFYGFENTVMRVGRMDGIRIEVKAHQHRF